MPQPWMAVSAAALLAGSSRAETAGLQARWSKAKPGTEQPVATSCRRQLPPLESLETRPLAALDHIVPVIEHLRVATVAVLCAIQIFLSGGGDDGCKTSSASQIGGAIGVPAMSVSRGGLVINSCSMINVIVLRLHLIENLWESPAR